MDSAQTAKAAGSPPKNLRHSALGIRHSPIAWCGWAIEGPGDWRPLKVMGDMRAGSMMIGDGERPLLLMQWRRIEPERFQGPRWLAERFRRQRAIPDAGAPCPAGFERAAWKRRLQVREGETKSVWCGYSLQARLVLELVTTHLAEEHTGYDVLQQVLPTLGVTPAEKPCRWAFFGAFFESPPGFGLQRRHLFLGDIALALGREDGETLLLRQVYPAGIAVARRPLEGWLDRPPFTERRRPPTMAPEKADLPGLEGVMRRGWKRLPSPLGWCNPRHSTALAAVDPGRDRLLIVDHQARDEKGEDTARWCLERMKEPGEAA